jgi:hypothetical protein
VCFCEILWLNQAYVLDYKEKDMAEDIKPRTLFEQRIEALIAQSSGIPPGEVMQLLLTADRNQDIDLEKELQALREKYNDKK